MKVHLSQLKGNNACFSKRSRDLNLSSGKDERYEQFVFQKAVIKNWFWSKSMRGREYDIKTAIMLIQDHLERELVEDDMLYVYDGVKSILRTDGQFDLRTGEFSEAKAYMTVLVACRTKYVEKLIARRYREFSFDTRETGKLLGRSIASRIFRYLSEETRDLIVPDKKDLDLFGQEVIGVRPDLLHIDEKSKSIEAIKLRCGKPDCTKNGKRPDHNILNNKELYGLYAYAKSVCAGRPDKDDWEIKASYYFLRKNSDRTGHIDPGYFGSKAPVATLEGLPDEIDAIYKPQFEEYIIGHDCDGDDCLDCDWYQLCHFAEAPLKTTVERKEKPLSAISLSAKQDEVVRHRNGIMRCNAGAGSGKTTVVALNTAFMIAEGIDPASILLITFSNAGAAEMRDRTRSYLKGLGIDMDVDDIRIVTFNEFGQDILNVEYEELGFTAPPRPIDATERSAIIARLLDKKTVPGLYYENINLKFKGFGGARHVAEAAFEIIKRDRLSVYDEKELCEKMGSRWAASISYAPESPYKALLELYEEYDAVLKSRNLIEFADQESMIFDVLDIDPYYFDKMGYKHIIIDEFQDTSTNQMAIIKQLLAVADFESLLVVGDDSQAIYGWRNADSDNIIEFEERIGQPVTDVNLVENHRSTPEILAFANAVNALNERRVDKDLIATRPSGKPVTVKGFHKVDKEYDYIVSVVKDKIAEGYQPEDIAILTRQKTEIVKIAGKLTEAGIESSLQAPQKMLENSRVQGICSLARAYKDITATKEVLIVENCLAGGKILALTDEEIAEVIEDGQQRILSIRSQFEPKRGEAFRELATEIAGSDDVAINLAERLNRFPTADEMVSYIDAFIRFDGDELKREGLYSGVVLSTAHSSKGLEWPVIINSITKYDRKEGMSDMEREEQRRLLFVSATRARDELYITGQIRLAGTAETGYAINKFVKEAAEIVGEKLDLYDVDGCKERAEKRKKRIKEEEAKAKAKAS